MVGGVSKKGIVSMAEQRRTAEIILLEVLDRLIRLDQLHDQVASQHRNMLQNLSYLPERHSKGS